MLQKGAGDHLSPQDQASWMSSGPARNVPHRVYFQGQREMAKLFIKNIQRALRRIELQAASALHHQINMFRGGTHGSILVLHLVSVNH